MYNLGYNDGRNFGRNGGSALVVLDFGQPTLNASGGAGNYGTNLFGGGGFIAFPDISLAADWYSVGWSYATAGYNRAYLYLGIGTNNFNQCVGGGPNCSPYNAGASLGYTVSQVQQAENNAGYSTITPLGADDIEGGWDCYTPTNSFQQGYHAYPYGLSDYGDVSNSNCIQGGTWTTYQGYMAAYGNGFTWPQVETYTIGQVNRWVTVAQTYWMSFQLGNMSQDNNPSGWFTVFSNALNNAGIGQTMYYSTNI
jgi:hypothetical protein